MKKRLFICIHYMEIGGAEMSLLGLLNAIDTNLYDVDLFVYSHQGELMKLIPDKIRLLPEIKEYANIESPMVSCFKKGCLKVLGGRLRAKYLYRQYARKNHPIDNFSIYQIVCEEVSPYLPSLYHYGEYDLAISFMPPHNIVLNKVQAKKKIAWIHTDYTKIGVDAVRELPIWSSYDYIASISDQVTDAFLKVFPSLSDKVILIENIISPDFVRLRSKAFTYQYDNGSKSINILSVGRFSEAKNFDNVPDICRRIRQQGFNVYWHLIGYGGDENLIRQKICESGMEQYVKILGKQENPYPYMVACDIYVQPSRYEGKSVTVREAQMLCKPVIVTNYNTSESQIDSGVDGVIVPMDNQSCADGIVSVLKNKELQKNIISYLQTHDYGNEEEVKKIEQLIN